MTATVVIATNDIPSINKLSAILIERDYSIIIEKSKIRSILKILDQKIDCIILDLDTPQDASLDLIGIIKRTRPKLPIIALSEDNSIDAVRKLKAAGVFYCAIKPIQDEEIEKSIDAISVLSQKSGQQESLHRAKVRTDSTYFCWS